MSTPHRAGDPSSAALSMAERADRYALYQCSVQSPKDDVDFFDATYRRYFKRKPRVLREDFCGTAAVCCAWVEHNKRRLALGIDLSGEALQWGREHNLGPLTPGQQARVKLLQQDVRSVTEVKSDIIVAQNYSFYLFDTRAALRTYLQLVFDNLLDEGLVVLDMMGGYAVLYEDHQDEREIDDDVTYIWDQHRFDPVTSTQQCFIHFQFSDGSRLDRAFEYTWRLWTVPEVKEILREVGFSKVDVYWEGTDDETGEGNGMFRVAKHAESDATWFAYIVGVKRKR